MTQIYKAEYRLTILEVDMGAPLSEKKKWLYVDAVKKLLDLGVTNFSAKFFYCDPRFFYGETRHNYGMRDSLLKSNQVSLMWEFRYTPEHYLIIVDRLTSGVEIPTTKIIVLKVLEDGARAKIEDFTIHSRDLSNLLTTLKLQYGVLSEIKYMQ